MKSLIFRWKIDFSFWRLKQNWSNFQIRQLIKLRGSSKKNTEKSLNMAKTKSSHTINILVIKSKIYGMISISLTKKCSFQHVLDEEWIIEKSWFEGIYSKELRKYLLLHRGESGSWKQWDHTVSMCKIIK